LQLITQRMMRSVVRSKSFD